MTARSSLTVVLAAGEGTRMRSSLPKVLHPVAGRVAAGACAGCRANGARRRLAVVIGPDHEAVADEVARMRPDAETFVQRERLGTAHAVLAAREAIARGADDLLVAFGDTPLISAETFARHARAAGEWRSARRARLSRRRSDRLWPAADRGRSTGRDPRACRRQRRGAQDHAVQCRRDGVRRPQGARNPRQDRQRQQQGRILSGRCRRYRQAKWDWRPS